MKGTSNPNSAKYDTYNNSNRLATCSQNNKKLWKFEMFRTENKKMEARLSIWKLSV